MGRFYRGFSWAELVTDLNTAAITGLSKLAASRQVTYTLNKPSTATGIVPSDDPRVNIPYPSPTDAPDLSFNERLLYMFRREDQNSSQPWVCRFAGLVMQIEDAVQDDQPYSTFTAFDPWQYLFARPILRLTDPGPPCVGELVGKDGLSYTATKGNVIAKQIVDNTICLHGGVYINTDLGTFEDTAPLDINFAQTTSVGAALAQLAATGTLDIVMEPVYDPDTLPGICCIMNVYRQAGSIRDDAVFSWDVGRSTQGISNLLDGDKMANQLQFFTGSGENPVTPVSDFTSETRFGYWSAQQAFPGTHLADAVAVEALAQYQLGLRANGKRTIRLTPSPLLAPIPLLDYGVGDRVPVYATKRLRQAIP